MPTRKFLTRHEVAALLQVVPSVIIRNVTSALSLWLLFMAFVPVSSFRSVLPI